MTMHKVQIKSDSAETCVTLTQVINLKAMGLLFKRSLDHVLQHRGLNQFHLMANHNIQTFF